MAIADSSGTKLFEYKYDAWGNPADAGTIPAAYQELARLNPFRYRGYVWDEETGLYYLRSRYYRPEWGRFVNCDSLIQNKRGNLDNNIYAYCENNLVAVSDNDGKNTDRIESYFQEQNTVPKYSIRALKPNEKLYPIAPKRITERIREFLKSKGLKMLNNVPVKEIDKNKYVTVVYKDFEKFPYKVELEMDRMPFPSIADYMSFAFMAIEGSCSVLASNSASQRLEPISKTGQLVGMFGSNQQIPSDSFLTKERSFEYIDGTLYPIDWADVSQGNW